jgi:thioredoxin 1
MTEKITSSAQFDELIKTQYILLADFSATWCGPCQAIKPTVESISKEYSDKVKVCVIDIDDNPNIAKKYQVKSVPTFLFFYKGTAVKKISGANPKALIAEVENLYNREK